MRSFELAMAKENGRVKVDEIGNEMIAFPQAQLPEYQTKYAAGADFFCAEEVTIPSIWSSLAKHVYDIVCERLTVPSFVLNSHQMNITNKALSPTLVHTGIKANMADNEVLLLYNRSSNPKKLGMILANGVGVIDKDYYANPANDGEIMFAFYNFKPWPVTLKVGDRIGQGIFEEVLRPEKGLRVKDVEREGGFGSTNIKYTK